MGLLEAGFYLTWTLMNYVGGRKKYKKFSNTEKVVTGAGVGGALDNILTPAVASGRTLHEILGFIPIEPWGTLIKTGGKIMAYGGAVYHTLKNIFTSEKEDKESK